jgi:hypothetical protein
VKSRHDCETQETRLSGCICMYQQHGIICVFSSRALSFSSRITVVTFSGHVKFVSVNLT